MRGPDRRDGETRRPSRFYKPDLTGLLQSLQLDVEYERGQGCHLYYRNEKREEIEVLDLVGGYGATLLGHCHPALVAEARRLLSADRPMLTQGSVGRYANELADELVRRLDAKYCVTYANSGSEAVEAAIKHAMLETGSCTFVVLERAFHGKTLGALQLTSHEHREELFTLSGIQAVPVKLNDIEHLESVFARTDGIAGFFLEPIQGEGGVRPLEPRFAQAAAALCRDAGVPLIADECQTGLGRTGRLLACEALGIDPDYVLLSKVLGGGMAKISALLIREERYRRSFDLMQTSTFAGDDHSCALALATLRLIDEQLLATCRRQGERLHAQLLRLRKGYPGVIADVRGRGLMMGIEFRTLERSSSFVLRMLSAQRDLGVVIAGYLLNEHRIRIAPTLGDPYTLRVAPAASIQDAEIDRVVAALERVCEYLDRGDAVGLTGYLARSGRVIPSAAAVSQSNGRIFAFDATRFRRPHADVPANAVAWLCHLVDSDDLVKLDRQFVELSVAQREEYLARLAPRADPTVMSAVDVRSRTGQQVRLYTILLPFTSQWVRDRIAMRESQAARALVQKGMDLARTLGCNVVSLGQYTSIVTHNGTQLSAHGMAVTSGNSYTAALVIQAIGRACDLRDGDPRSSTLVIVGAAGSIGALCAEYLAPRYRRVILVGSTGRGSRARLERLARRLPNAEWSIDLSVVGKGDVVIASTSAVGPPLGPQHFKLGAVVCDVSVPAAVQLETMVQRSDLETIAGGIVRLPFDEDLEIAGFPLGKGQAYGCMAEGMLLGFEGEQDGAFGGALTADHIARISTVADRHGFTMDYQRRVATAGSPELV